MNEDKLKTAQIGELKIFNYMFSGSRKNMLDSHDSVS
jgi:hypothetical protein